MKVYETNEIRNVALLGHGASGKTTFAEAVIHTCGATSRMGKIENGNTKSDYLDDEISRQISISTSLLQAEWANRKINLIDTPGYADFIGEVICGIRAADSVLIFIDAVTGLEVGTEAAWEICEKNDKPIVFIVNRCGKEHAKTDEVLKAIQDRFGHKALPIQIPVNSGVGFTKIIDFVSMMEYTYDIDGEGKGKAGDISENFKGAAEEYHEKLIEAAAESDDTLLEKFFDSGLSSDEVSAGIKKAIQERSLYPIVFTDSYTNVGTDLVLRLITESIPSPSDMPNYTGKKSGNAEIELQPSTNAPLTIQVFKTVIEQHVGELSLFRVFSGSYKAGDELYNYHHGSSERPTAMFTLVGKDRTDISTINAGDIGCFVKMKSTKTSDTLCSKQMQIALPPLEFPEPVMDVAVYPKTKGEEDKITQGLAKIHDEDPSFRLSTNSELKQIILEGLGGLHIEVIIDRFKRKFGVDVDLKEPKIPYRETITGKSDERYRYKKQTGGRGQYGEVYFRMEPLPRGEGFEFANEIKGGVIPSRFIPAVEKGLVEAMETGPLSKCKVIDLRVALYYGSFHTVDSSELAFKMAASMCFKECFLKARPILLEPIYNIEVKVPDAYTGDVMGDLSSRRGKIMGMEPSGIFQIVKAQVPLSELYMYATQLRSLTQGRGAYTRNFSHYEMVPPDISQKIIEATKADED
ncbi:MAG: elongation factor G [Candidatus Latescibacteria bacterium]|nr:elongation factor G [Candidatus Latescibacterota bacterium]